MDRRKFLAGLLGTAAMPVVAKAELILPPLVEVIELPTRWCIMCETSQMARALFYQYRQQLLLTDQIMIDSNTLRLSIWGMTELQFMSGKESEERLAGTEFTGAYFIGNVSHKDRAQTLSRTQRYPHYKMLPENFEWPEINERIEELMRTLG